MFFTYPLGPIWAMSLGL